MSKNRIPIWYEHFFIQYLQMYRCYFWLCAILLLERYAPGIVAIACRTRGLAKNTKKERRNRAPFFVFFCGLRGGNYKRKARSGALNT